MEINRLFFSIRFTSVRVMISQVFRKIVSERIAAVRNGFPGVQKDRTMTIIWLAASYRFTIAFFTLLSSTGRL